MATNLRDANPYTPPRLDNAKEALGPRRHIVWFASGTVVGLLCLFVQSGPWMLLRSIRIQPIFFVILLAAGWVLGSAVAFICFRRPCGDLERWKRRGIRFTSGLLFGYVAMQAQSKIRVLTEQFITAGPLTLLLNLFAGIVAGVVIATLIERIALALFSKTRSGAVREA